MNCPKCGALIEADTKFCSSCGAPLEPMEDTVGAESNKELPPPPPPPLPPIGIPVPPLTTGTTLQPTQTSSSQIGIPTALPNTDVKKDSSNNTDVPNFGKPIKPKKKGGKKLILSVLIISILLGVRFCMHEEKKNSHVINEPAVSESTVNNKSKQTSTIDNGKEITDKDKTDNSAKDNVIAYNSPTPDGVFYYYHQKITEHDLHEAYRCFSPDFKQQVSYDGWAPGYDTTVKSYPEKTEVLSNDGYKAVLSFRLMAQDKINGANVVQYFAGQATLYKIDGLWKIDEISARKV